MSALQGLRCPECGASFDADRAETFCQPCQSPVLAYYNLNGLRGDLDRDELSRRPAGLWRWAELLPVRDRSRRVGLGEGETPLLRARRLGTEIGLDDLYVKDEGVNPTGTFKARGMAVAVSRAAELGLGELVTASAGNAGGALATYAARAGLQAHVSMPSDAPPSACEEVRATGGDLQLLDGLLDGVARIASQEAEARGWFDVSTFREPYRVEGKKTMGFELAEALGWELPDVVLFPTGGGTGLVGLWKAFGELEQLGWIGSRRPRMVAVQPIGCGPVVRALERGTTRVERWDEARTAAHGLRVPKPFAGRLLLRTIRESCGTGVCVSEDEMRNGRRLLASLEGILPSLEGAAAVAAAHRLAKTGWLRPQERVVLFNTGSGLKDL